MTPRASHSGNPFITGQAVRDADFVGRENNLRQVEQFLNDKHARHLLITGHRRSGKTSFLKKLQRLHQTPERVFVYFNLQDKADISLSKLTAHLRERTMRVLPFEHPYYSKKSFPEYLNAALENSSKSIVWLFDEFDVMCPSVSGQSEKSLEARSAFADWLENLHLLHPYIAEKLKIIFAVGTNYRENIEKTCGKLAKNAKIIRLDELALPDIRSLLSLAIPIVFSDDAVLYLTKLSGGHPFFLQIIAAEAFEYAENNHLQLIDKEIIDKILPETLATYRFSLNSIWDGFKDAERQTLSTISACSTENEQPTFDILKSRVHTNSEQLATIIKSLKYNGFIQETEAHTFYPTAGLLNFTLTETE